MISLVDETGRLEPGQSDRLEAVLTTWLSEQDIPDSDGEPVMTLILLDDGQRHELNLRDRQVDDATDVLSYPAHEPDDDGFPEIPFLGDVFISIDTAARQAADAGHGFLDELLVLAAHGVTHLLGYDHQTEEEWKVFRTAQSRILELGRQKPG